MALMESAREHWFSVTLYTLFAVFFLVSGLLSTATYVRVVSTQDNVALEEVSYTATELANGSLELTFTIDLVNPSRYDLMMQSVVWQAYITNGTSANPGWYIPLGSSYTGPTSYVEVPAGGSRTFGYGVVVSDSETLTRLRGLVNHTVLSGEDVTLETLPYTHEFHAVAWIGDFKHDYLREMYLNDLVKIQLDYLSGVTP